MDDTKEANLVYRAAKNFVRENHPELEPHFNDIWKLSGNKESLETFAKRKLGVASLVNNEILVQIAQAVIPFFRELCLLLWLT